MNCSSCGLKLVSFSEGFKLEWLKPYLDPVGIPTIGTGHKILPTDVIPENGITMDQMYAFLAIDIGKVETFLNFFFRRNQLTCTQNQFDALCDFGFNLGVGSLGQMLAHGFDKIPLQLPLWTHAGGRELPGLVQRRKNELVVFSSTQVVVDVSFDHEDNIVLHYAIPN